VSYKKFEVVEEIKAMPGNGKKAMFTRTLSKYTGGVRRAL
jgi:hypothetical protein